jgi:hypothetical protein
MPNFIKTFSPNQHHSAIPTIGFRLGLGPGPVPQWHPNCRHFSYAGSLASSLHLFWVDQIVSESLIFLVQRGLYRFCDSFHNSFPIMTVFNKLIWLIRDFSVSERNAIIFCLGVLMCEYLLTYSWPFLPDFIPFASAYNPDNNDNNHQTAFGNASQQQPVSNCGAQSQPGCPSQYVWCATTTRWAIISKDAGSCSSDIFLAIQKNFYA